MAVEDNKMREILLEKVVINIGIGYNDNMLPNAKALLKKITGKEAMATYSKRRDPSLRLRKGQAIGAMVTLRKDDAVNALKRMLDAKGNVVRMNSISENTLSFGIKEYIDIAGIKYDPKIGMMGMHVNSSFARRGKRVSSRKRFSSSIGKKHSIITKEELADYLKKNYDAKISEE
jgi:large subunit ribosomal protein L5